MNRRIDEALWRHRAVVAIVSLRVGETNDRRRREELDGGEQSSDCGTPEQYEGTDRYATLGDIEGCP